MLSGPYGVAAAMFGDDGPAGRCATVSLCMISLGTMFLLRLCVEEQTVSRFCFHVDGALCVCFVFLLC